MAGEGSFLKQIKTRLAAFDDDALAALASRGLLRRAQKDLETAPTEILDQSETSVRVLVDDAVVEVADPPQNSKCNCPSGGICRHILAALILLRASIDEEAAPTSCDEEILAVDDVSLRKWAGTSLVRRALRTLSRGLQVQWEGSGPVVFEIPALNVTCRWIPGAGLQGMVCSCHAAGTCEHRVMAVLAYQADKGARKIEDDARAIEASSEAPRSRQEVIESVKDVLREMVSQGMSRSSASLLERLQTLAVSAHGVDLPRLERFLAALGDEVRLLVARDAQADSRNLLWATARAEALCSALANPTPALVGEHRSAYQPVGNIELAGMGARRWRTRSGYVGITVYFWDKSLDKWATWSDSRPVSIENYDPITRFYQDGPWPGCVSPADAAQSRLKLKSAYRNSSGRLSGREATSATMAGDSNPLDIPIGINSWTELLGRVASLVAQGLGERNEQDELVVLIPSKWGTPTFDHIRQELVWPVYDDNQRELSLILPHTPETSDAITVIERSDPDGPAGVMGILRFSHGRITVEPVSLYRKDGRIFNVTLEGGKRILAKPDQTKQVDASEEDDRPEEVSTESSSTPLGLLLAAMEYEIEAAVEGGLAAVGDLARLQNLASRAQSVGLASCAHGLSQLTDKLEALRKTPASDPSPAAEALLRAYYVLRLASAQEIALAMVGYSSSA